MIAKPEYYQDKRYLRKNEVVTCPDMVIVRSRDFKDRPLYEMYRKNGIKLGKLDHGRGWVADILNTSGSVDKDDFLAE